MKRYPRFAALCALVLALMLVLTACGAQETPQERVDRFTPRLDSQTEGAVTVVGHPQRNSRTNHA